MFTLHPRLDADTRSLADWPLCRVLLMNDARYHWLILVPRRPGLVEIDELDDTERRQLIEEIAAASRLLKGETGCDKINVGALGNLVPQLHIHVIARRKNDAAWPGPVWGNGAAEPYGEAELQAAIARLQQPLSAAFPTQA